MSFLTTASDTVASQKKGQNGNILVLLVAAQVLDAGVVVMSGSAVSVSFLVTIVFMIIIVTIRVISVAFLLLLTVGSAVTVTDDQVVQVVLSITTPVIIKVD